MSLIRDEIVRIARAEATPAPHGKVSDLVRDGEGRRAGWQHLKKYFDDAVAGWSESKWSDRGSIKIGEQSVKLTNLEGIQKPGLRVIQGAFLVRNLRHLGLEAGRSESRCVASGSWPAWERRYNREQNHGLSAGRHHRDPER